MTEDRFEFKPEEVQVYIDRAKEMRAQAMREFFSDFRNSVKNVFGRVTHSMDVPQTEQL